MFLVAFMNTSQTKSQYIDIIKPIVFTVVADKRLYNEFLESDLRQDVGPFADTAAYGAWLGQRRAGIQEPLLNILEVFLWIVYLRGL